MKTLRSPRLVTLAVLACVPFFSGLAHAESPADAALRARTKQKLTAMFKNVTSGQRLQLSEAQRKKMEGLMKNSFKPGQRPSTAQMAAYRKKMEAILTPQQRKQIADQRAKTEKIGQQTLAWVASELKFSPAQKSKALAMISEGAERGGMMGGGRGPGGPGGGDRRGGGQGGPGGGPGRMGGGRRGGGLMTFFGRRDRISEILTPAQKPKWEIMKSAARETMTAQFGGGRSFGGPGPGGGPGRMGGGRRGA